MKITTVEPQKQNPHRFNIYLDGKFGFGADEDTVVKFRLVPGKEIAAEDLDKILLETEVGKLMGRMYGWFGVRMRSEGEVRQKFKIQNSKFKILGKEEISDLLIEKVIENLKQKGLINDLEFAKAWVESRRRSKKKGVNSLKMELFQKGIDREIIEEVLLEQVSEGSENDLAAQALEKKAKSWKNLSEMDFKKKAIEFLMRRGFSYEVAKKTANNYLKID